MEQRATALPRRDLPSSSGWASDCFSSCPHWVPDARKNVYDGMVEYWITVRERGMHEEEHEVVEQQKSRSKVGLTRHTCSPANLTYYLTLYH